MKPRPKLWAAIRERGLKQKDFAKLVGDHPSIVSRIVTGQWRIDEERKLRYARVLKRRAGEVFDDES